MFFVNDGSCSVEILVDLKAFISGLVAAERQEAEKRVEEITRELVETILELQNIEEVVADLQKRLARVRHGVAKRAAQETARLAALEGEGNDTKHAS